MPRSTRAHARATRRTSRPNHMPALPTKEDQERLDIARLHAKTSIRVQSVRGPGEGRLCERSYAIAVSR